MQEIDQPGQRRIVSIPSLTAWLSLCILAAAFGHSLDERWQDIWTYMGTFGLVASVGLGCLEQARLTHRKWTQDRALRTRVECGLERLTEQGATLDSINAAIRRLNKAAARNWQHESSHAGVATRAGQSQLLSRLPLSIAPVVDQGDDESCELAASIPGSLREVSSRGISFSHVQPFIARVVLLTFKLGQQQRLSFVVDVIWTEASGDEFVSGGSMLAVGVPERADRQPVAEQFAEACPV